MASAARGAFDKNVQDIKRLLDLHEHLGGKQPGRRYGLEVLNKSAIVLITSFWESYCEDIAAEALAHVVKHAKSADALPKELKKMIAKELEQDPHDLALWGLAGNGWRKMVQERLEGIQESRNRKLNAPRTENINKLFESALGIVKISNSWRLAQNMPARKSEEKLDRFVTLRGSIAHRGKAEGPVKKAHVVDYLDFVSRLAATTGGEVNKYVHVVTGRYLWKNAA